MRTGAVALALLGAAPGGAGERAVGVTAFDRLRIETPVEVRITTGGSPGARVSGDAAALDGIDLRQSGTTLTIARRGTAGGAVTVVLTTPTLATASVSGGARVTVDRMKGMRVDLSLAGNGAVTVDRVEADLVSALLVGDGAMTLAGGKARSVRLIANGAGTLDAARLEADELSVRRDGVGETRARARYAAEVTNAGVGRVSVAGSPRCTVRVAAGPVACGREGP